MPEDCEAKCCLLHEERTAPYRVREDRREASKAQLQPWQQDAMAAGTAHLL
jgi:hypothetical protein